MKAFGLAVIAVTFLASPAAAEHCGNDFKGFWDKLERDRYASVSPEQLAGISRMALRAYDACQGGDEREAKALFGKLALLHGERDRSTGPYNPNLPSR